MGYNTAETDWPSSAKLSEDKQELLDYYFSLLDTNEATTGNKLAKIFADDGCIISPAGTARGHEQILKSRQHAWNVIKTRLHKLTRVYVFDSEAMDLLVIGTAVQGLANGKSISGEWVARICFEQASLTGILKIKSHQVWADFGGVQKAIQGALANS